MEQVTVNKVVEMLERMVVNSNEILNNKKQSEAFVVGYLQGTINIAVSELKKIVTTKKYQIFYDLKDVNACLTFECESLEQLKEELIEEGTMEEGREISDFEWVVYENGEQIQ